MPVRSTAQPTRRPPTPQPCLPVRFLDTFIGHHEPNTPGIDESCSSHVSHLSQRQPALPAAQGIIRTVFLDALSSVHVLSPHPHPLRSTVTVDPGFRGFPPPLFPPRNILGLQHSPENTGRSMAVLHPRPPPSEGRVLPAASQGHGGSLHLPGTRQARTRLGLCLTSPDTFLVSFLISFGPLLRNHFLCCEDEGVNM